MKKSRNQAIKFLRVFFILLLFAILCGLFFFFSIYFSAHLDKNAVISQKANVILYSSSNTEITNDNISRYVKYDEISPNIISAFVALEDRRFFKHKGIDYYRTAGAIVNNAKAGYIKEGGSTITQQLAKNTLLSNEKTIVRKIKEMKLAKDIEKQYTKEEILEFYLNAIYFGNGIYGIGSACRNYFNKSANEVTIAESAYLAGIVKSPIMYSPINNLDKATERKNLVLKLMYNQGYINESEFEQEYKYIYVKKAGKNSDIISPYYQNALIESSRILGIREKDLMLGNYKIFTYYDENIQKIFYNAYLSNEFDCINEYQNTASYSSLLADNTSGGIKGYFCNFDNSIYDFSRQPASAIKPILVYAPAIENKKIHPATPILDEKININGYSPNNYGNKYYGWIDAQKALCYSSNSASVKIMNETGIDICKKTASGMGINFSPNDNGLSLALGGMENGVNFSEITAAYMCLANMGKYKKCTFIKAIYDKNNNLIYNNENSEKQIISKETSFLINEMLCQAVNNGTAKKLSDINVTIAGKTGTNGYPDSKNNLDSWCVSYTPDVTLCVWYGDLDNSKENAAATTGGVYPALLSRYIYSALDLKDKKFLIPEGIISLDIDKYAAGIEHKIYLANTFTPEECILSVYFDESNAPEEFSPYFDFNKFYFSAENNLEMKNVKLEFSIIKPYIIKIFRQNMFTGETAEVIITQNNQDKIVCEDFIEELCVYNYFVEFYYGDKKLNYSPSKMVFT